MILFLTWRVNTPNNKAYWLWFTSVVCEIWFAVSWLFDQVRGPARKRILSTFSSERSL
jgi:hypothetical protein